MALVTDTISEICNEGLRTSDGTLHHVDTIIYATGFDLNKCLLATKQIGISGNKQDLKSRAFFGMTHPEYPNYFSLLGKKISKNL